MLGGVIAFVFGLIWGSFLNVVIYRYDDWLSIVSHPSHCRHCKKRLNWFDLIPVLSFLFLRGKCRYCFKPISWQYPIVELSTAFLFASGWWLVFVNSDLANIRAIFTFVLYVLAVSLMLVIFFHDLREMMIPDSLAYALVVAAYLFGWIYSGKPLETLYGGLLAVLPIILLVYPSRGKWMGEGDVKIALALGFLVGWPLAGVFLIGAFLFGGVFGAIALLLKAVKLKSAVPFTPFLIISALVTLFWGNFLLKWYLEGIFYGF